jgi:hypothetical protein
MYAPSLGPMGVPDALDCRPSTYEPTTTKSCSGERLPRRRISTRWHAMKSGINIVEEAEGSPEVLT